MNCPEAQDAIQHYLDGDESSSILSAAWNEHLQACSRCRRDFAAAQTLRLGLRDLPRPEAPVLSTSRLVELVDRDRRFRGRLQWWRNAWILATAASLLAFVGYGLLHRETPPEADPIVPHGLAQNDPETNDVPRTADAEKAVTALAQAVQENTQEQIRALLGAAIPLDSKTARMPIDVDPSLDPAQQAAQSFRSASRNMAETFEPMANSARQAALFFAREIPVDFPMREN
jgi:hypothetical protein